MNAYCPFKARLRKNMSAVDERIAAATARGRKGRTKVSEGEPPSTTSCEFQADFERWQSASLPSERTWNCVPCCTRRARKNVSLVCVTFSPMMRMLAPCEIVKCSASANGSRRGVRHLPRNSFAQLRARRRKLLEFSVKLNDCALKRNFLARIIRRIVASLSAAAACAAATDFASS